MIRLKKGSQARSIADTQYRTKEWVQDLRVGGRWKATGLGADGVPFTVEGEFLEIDPPRCLVQTWRPEWDGGHATRLTYRLDAIEGGTRVTVRHEGFGDRHESCSSHAEGWSSVLGWLRDFAAPAAGSSDDKYFLCRLIPPRPSFPFDMNEAERATMQEHVGYWTAQMNAGTAVIFGPVADPKGAWGLGVVRVKDEAEVRAFEAGDPAIRSKHGFRYEILPMLQAIVASCAAWLARAPASPPGLPGGGRATFAIERRSQHSQKLCAPERREIFESCGKLSWDDGRMSAERADFKWSSAPRVSAEEFAAVQSEGATTR